MSYEAFAFHAIANRIQITYDGCFAHVGLVRMDDELILYLYLKERSLNDGKLSRKDLYNETLNFATFTLAAEGVLGEPNWQ